MTEITLTGPQGDNPLGFLTALGTLCVLTDLDHRVALHWTRQRQPVLTLDDSWDRQCIVDQVWNSVAREAGASQSQTRAAQGEWDEAKKAVTRKRADLKKRRLRRQEAKDARAVELLPLVAVRDEKRRMYLTYLRESAPDPSVTLGKNLTAANSEFTAYCEDSVTQVSPEQRRWADLCAGFGIANPDEPDNRMIATPFALVSGSGHQDFR